MSKSRAIAKKLITKQRSWPLSRSPAENGNVAEIGLNRANLTQGRNMWRRLLECPECIREELQRIDQSYSRHWLSSFRREPPWHTTKLIPDDKQKQKNLLASLWYTSDISNLVNVSFVWYSEIFRRDAIITKMRKHKLLQNNP